MNYFDFSSLRTIPRWIILLIDTCVMAWAFSTAYFFIHNFSISRVIQREFTLVLLVYTVLSVLVLYALRTYTGLVRYTNTADIARILGTTLLTTSSFGVLCWIGVVPSSKLSLQGIWKLLILN